MTLGAADDGTGVAGTEYRVDGGDWISGTTVTIPATPDGSNDGVHVVQYRSTDNFGHVEEIKTSNVKIVTQAPTTTVSGADGAWHDSDVMLSFASASAGDPVVEYQIDGGAWVTGSSVTIPATPDGSNDGEHTIRYRSTNALGMVETAKSVTVRIDAGAPTTTLSGGDGAWHDSDVTLGFSGSDAGSGVVKTEYRIDGDAWVEGTSATVPAPADGSNDGTHMVEYRSTDASGHVETAKSATVKIDAGDPTTSASGADDLWHDADVTVTLSGSDAGSGVAKTEYRIDGGAWVEGTLILIAAPADGSNDGAHTVEYRSTDDAGNVETAHSVVVKIVTVAPTTSAAGSDDAWHDSDVTLTFSTSGAGVAKTEYRIDGGAWVEGTSATVPAPADGSNDGDPHGRVPLDQRSRPRRVGEELDRQDRRRRPDDERRGRRRPLARRRRDRDPLGLRRRQRRRQDRVPHRRRRLGRGHLDHVAAPADGSNDGDHTVEYRSTDDAGNVETCPSRSRSRSTSPRRRRLSGADGAWHNSDVHTGLPERPRRHAASPRPSTASTAATG